MHTNHPKTVILCPKCRQHQLVCYGYNPDGWHDDAKTGTSIRQIYVSCPCAQNLIEYTETLKDIPGKPGRMLLTKEAKTLPLPLAFAPEP